jgi:hypothetical protein
MIHLQWKYLLLALMIVFSASGGPVSGNEGNAVIQLNRDFYLKLRSAQVILRDEFLNTMLNSDVSGRGVIVSTGKGKRYGKELIIIAGDEDSGKLQFDVTYHIYAGKGVDPSRLIPGGIIEFRGTLVLCTPLNTERNRFIFDIILDEESYSVK